MNAAIAFCAIALTGWAAPQTGEPSNNPGGLPFESEMPRVVWRQAEQPSEQRAENTTSQPWELGPLDDKQPSDQRTERTSYTYTPSAPARLARPTSVGLSSHPSRMPLAPTDPRACTDNVMPMPPTMNNNAAPPSSGMAATGPRRDGAGVAANGARQNPAQKPFEHVPTTPAVSPYLLLTTANTNNGTVDPYMTYVRPALDQQRANQEMERAMTNLEHSDDAGPSYPRAFSKNFGAYFPDTGGGR